MTIPVIHMFDNRYAVAAAVAFKSLLEKASRAHYYRLIVLENDISTENKQRLHSVVEAYSNATLEFHPPVNDCAEIFTGVLNKAHFSKEVIYKLLIPDQFPELHFAIVSDVDCIYLDDISLVCEEFLSEGKGCIIGGVAPAKRSVRILDGFNSQYEKDFSDAERNALHWGVCGGLLVYDLDEMRNFCFSEKAMRYIRENAYRLIQLEQDVINLVGEGRLYYLQDRSMVSMAYYVLTNENEKKKMCDTLKHPIQLHYSSAKKPWNNPTGPKSNLWWEVCARTPFFCDAIGAFVPKRHEGACGKTKWGVCGLPLVTIRIAGEVESVRMVGLELQKQHH